MSYSSVLASFETNNSNPVKNESIEFDASKSKGSISTYEWAWTDDGVFEETGRTVEHLYDNTGDKTVALKVTGENGDTNQLVRTIEVSDVDYFNGFSQFRTTERMVGTDETEGPKKTPINQKWNFTTGSNVQSSPAFYEGMVYVGSYDNNLYALNASTGSLERNYTTGNNIHSSPTAANDKFYIGSQDG